VKIQWSNNNKSLTLTASDNYDRLFLSIIDKQVCDRGVYVASVESRLKDAQSKMHETCDELARLKEARTLISRIRKFFSMEIGIQ